MHNSEQKCAHFCSEWRILGYGIGALWDWGIRSTESEYTGLQRIPNQALWHFIPTGCSILNSVKKFSLMKSRHMCVSDKYDTFYEVPRGGLWVIDSQILCFVVWYGSMWQPSFGNTKALPSVIVLSILRRWNGQTVNWNGNELSSFAPIVAYVLTVI